MVKSIMSILVAFAVAIGCCAQETRVLSSSHSLEDERIENSNSRRVLRGYKAFYEVEYGFDMDNYEYSNGRLIPDYPSCRNLMISTTQGYQFNNFVFAGGGIGMLRYLDGKKTLMPVFATVRFNLLNNKRIEPFAEERVGGVIGTWGGFYGSTWIGARLKTTDRHAVALSVGVSTHFYRDDRYNLDLDHSDGGWQWKISRGAGWDAVSVNLRLGYEF